MDIDLYIYVLPAILKQAIPTNMKKYLSVIFVFISSIAFSQTQGEMNQNAHAEYKKAEKEINYVYQKILKEYSSDVAFIKNLKTAERLWIEFRDAEMKAKFPDREEGYYGSVQPMCWYSYLTKLTRERIKTLKIWLTGLPEGDVCNGSVKSSNE